MWIDGPVEPMYDQMLAYYHIIRQKKLCREAYISGVRRGFFKLSHSKADQMNDEQLENFESGIIVGLGMSLIEYLKFEYELAKNGKHQESLKERFKECM